MTQFEPTREDLTFRLAISLAGIALMMAAVSLRGLPTEPAALQAGLLALTFLAVSAAVSALRLHRLDRD